ncbi:DUF551 domain-containing protein [Shigella sonnei]|nr:DUF551 domain-containing protein [Shigella flexneri]
MTTITKERIELFIKNPLENGLTRGEQMELARIALASLEAEPVAWMRDDADGREYNARNEFSGGGGGVPLYATPPVPVVPEEKPMPNPLSMYAVDAVAAIAEVRGWNACRAAMLHGAEPVSQTYKLNELAGNSPVTPDGHVQFSVSLPAAFGGDKYFIDGVFQPLRYERDCERAVVAAGGVVNWVK